MNIKDQLKNKYDEQYNNNLDKWRMLGGEAKAHNIIKIAGDLNPHKILDIGSGDGGVLYWLDKYKFCEHISSVEISQSGVEKIKSKNLISVKEVLLFDGYSLPFVDDSFDLAICSHVIEHVEFPRKLIREIVRVSKEQIFEIPIDFTLNVDKKVNHFLSYGHINIYSPQTFRFLLKSEGLEIQSYNNSLYNKKVYSYMNKDKSLIYKYKNNIKRLLWRLIPFFMAIKPDVTTVRTRKTDNSLEIMTSS